jgi:hypothetical protein
MGRLEEVKTMDSTGLQTAMVLISCVRVDVVECTPVAIVVTSLLVLLWSAEDVQPVVHAVKVAGSRGVSPT